MEITHHDMNRRGFDFYHMEYREEWGKFSSTDERIEMYFHVHQPDLPEVSTLKGTKVRLVLGVTVVQEHGKRTGACRACASIKNGTRR